MKIFGRALPSFQRELNLLFMSAPINGLLAIFLLQLNACISLHPRYPGRASQCNLSGSHSNAHCTADGPSVGNLYHTPHKLIWQWHKQRSYLHQLWWILCMSFAHSGHTALHCSFRGEAVGEFLTSTLHLYPTAQQYPQRLVWYSACAAFALYNVYDYIFKVSWVYWKHLNESLRSKHEI